MKTLCAFLIHLLTASGGAFAVLATLAAADLQWSDMFLWLFAAQVVDGIDGPLARKFEVSKHLPNWSGDSLDYVIDYATYVFIPAIAFARADLLPAPYGLLAACLIVISGGLYFADNRMKTKSNAFRGFPAVWNGVLFYFFLFTPSPILGFVIIVLLAVGQFLPVEFIHPVRVAAYRPLTLAVMALWAVFCFLVIRNDMMPTALDQIVLGLTGLYLFAVGPILHYQRSQRH
ncbi:CDP-alcohol phosphatidyltransferase family protein [Cohaesibacter celericrescens]|uniref:Phosphatidylcholine synthase n=1 Tax=Cohaesibacter celericrescens TaxID=2067669 RepID=A0A2N5XT10_9HYPH|nr:CDP-alcohol phosphatidyltransferase family protein [Cohaesibacter celericrescens]PLW77629.1 phosphatidylcholine synthase [Cohaesibacter celericrescens]